MSPPIGPRRQWKGPAVKSETHSVGDVSFRAAPQLRQAYANEQRAGVGLQHASGKVGGKGTSRFNSGRSNGELKRSHKCNMRRQEKNRYKQVFIWCTCKYETGSALQLHSFHNHSSASKQKPHSCARNSNNIVQLAKACQVPLLCSGVSLALLPTLQQLRYIHT